MTRPQPNDRYLSVDALRAEVARGDLDTVVVALTDMQGRLQGKRMHAAYFLEHVLGQGTEGCNYLLAVDVDMTPVPGYALTSWESGYGDLEFALDLATLRRLPYEPGAAMVQCDLVQLDHSPVPQSPRTMLTTQLERLAERGLVALAGTELEFIAFSTSYEDAWSSGYRDLVPVNQYNVDYSILGGARVEPLLREIRNAMYGAGMDVESAKGECNLGQHEIGFLYADALTTADNHAVYKTAAKQIAANRGQSLTFMAKYDEREGSSCHVHLSLRGADGSTTFWEDGSDGVRPSNRPDEGGLGSTEREDRERVRSPGSSEGRSPLSSSGGRSPLYDSFIAGLLATMADFTLLYAPNVNSYKRFAAGSFAPTTIAWGEDNRTCALRLVGHGQSARLENRVPGGDVNPYLAIAAMIAGGLHGIDEGLELGPALVGNAYDPAGAALPKIPSTLRDARDAFSSSAVARACFGDEVVDHYTRMAEVELTAFDAAVTDWELRRSFERM